jgi:hypothetical protein
VLNRADHALFGHRALIVIEAGRVAREIDEVLGCTLSRPLGPVARRPKRGELIILPDERDHALAGGVVELTKCQLADRLIAKAAPGEGWRGVQQLCRRERCKLGHEQQLPYTGRCVDTSDKLTSNTSVRKSRGRSVHDEPLYHGRCARRSPF